MTPADQLTAVKSVIDILAKCPNPDCPESKVEAHGYAMEPYLKRMSIACRGCYCFVDMPTRSRAIVAWNTAGTDTPAILHDESACITRERFEKLESDSKQLRDALESLLSGSDDEPHPNSHGCLMRSVMEHDWQRAERVLGEIEMEREGGKVE